MGLKLLNLVVLYSAMCIFEDKLYDYTFAPGRCFKQEIDLPLSIWTEDWLKETARFRAAKLLHSGVFGRQTFEQ